MDRGFHFSFGPQETALPVFGFEEEAEPFLGFEARGTDRTRKARNPSLPGALHGRVHDLALVVQVEANVRPQSLRRKQ